MWEKKKLPKVSKPSAWTTSKLVVSVTEVF